MNRIRRILRSVTVLAGLLAAALAVLADRAWTAHRKTTLPAG